VAKADYDKAKALAQYQQIRAPFDGVITERKVDPGAFVRPASGEDVIPLVTVDQINKLRAVIHVTMDQTVHLDIGDRIELVVDDVPGKKFPGAVSRTAGVFDERTRMMRVEVDLDNFPSDATGHRPLWAGTYGEVTIVTADESLVVVPKAAIGQNAATLWEFCRESSPVTALLPVTQTRSKTSKDSRRIQSRN
jgi:RND family efflux transporter MFP subunit